MGSPEIRVVPCILAIEDEKRLNICLRVGKENSLTYLAPAARDSGKDAFSSAIWINLFIFWKRRIISHHKKIISERAIVKSHVLSVRIHDRSPIILKIAFPKKEIVKL
jgi:hypothetical protein